MKIYFQKFFFRLIKSKQIDIFCLDEAAADKDDFGNNVKNYLPEYNFIDEGLLNGAHGCLRIYSKIEVVNFDPKEKSKRFVNLSFKNRFDLCFVHFKSLTRTDSYNKLKEDEEIIKQIYHVQPYEKKFLIGDFNASPYSQTMLDSRFLNTIRCGEQNFKIKRVGLSEHKRINPSWTAFSEKADGIYGTLPRNATTQDNIGMQLFDQVVFDEGLQVFYVPNSFEIISSVKGKKKEFQIMDDDFKSKFSDHLPIMFSLHNL